MEYIKLKDICTTTQGTQISKENQYENLNEGLIRYLYIADFKEDNDIKYVKDVYKEKIVSEDDLVMANTGSPGAVFKGKYGVLSNNLFKISFDRNVLIRDFLYYYLSSDEFQHNLQKRMKGGVQKHLGHKLIGEQPIPVIDLETQKKIVEVLDKAQELIDKRKDQIELLDELVKSMFIEMFAKYESSYCTTIEEISDMVTVGIANSATHAYSDSGVIMFRNQNIKEGYLDDKDVIYITSEFADKYKTKTLKENDLLVTRTGYPGVASLVPKKYEGCQTFTTLIIRLKDLDSIRHRYVCNYINSIYGKRYVNEMKVGVAQQNFGAKALEKMPIFIPPIDEQIKFENFQKQVEQLKSQMETSLKELEDNFNSLMQKAFKGELF